MSVKALALPGLKATVSFRSERVKIALALLAVYTIWGSTYLALRIAVESIPPFMMSGIRYLVAGGALFAFLWLRGTPLPNRRQVRGAVLLGILMLGLGTGGVAFAEQWVASGLAATAVASVPIWAAIFAGLWGRWPRRREWFGLALGLAGVALLNMENGMQANPLGAMVLVIAPMSWSFGSILSRRLELPDGLMGAAVEMLGGSAFLMLLSVAFRENLTQAPSGQSLLAVLYLVVFGSLIAFTAYMYLLRTVRPVLATSYAYANPVIAVLLGALLGSEHITPLGIAAMGVILGGVALLTLAKERVS